MDPTTHTIIATVLLYIAYKVGDYFGTKRGFALGEASVLILLMSTLKGDKIDIDEENGITVYDKDGNGRKIE